ncbi:MAG: hypothetical protein ACREHD_09120 [Pirellulales bacterium]
MTSHFAPDREDGHERLWFLGNIVVHAQIPQPELPRCKRVGPHAFTIARTDRRLMDELRVDSIQHNSTLPRGKLV